MTMEMTKTDKMKGKQIGKTVIEYVPKEWLTAEEACVYLGIKRDQLYRLNHQRVIPQYKPGGKCCFYFIEDLREYMKRTRVMTAAEIRGEVEAKVREMSVKPII